jgi:O-Antigen ligase
MPRQFDLRPSWTAGPPGFATEVDGHDPSRAEIQRNAVRMRSPSSTLDILFAFGLVLSISSQLRFGGTSIGPGDICLLVWLVLMLGRTALQRGPVATPALSRMLIFWLLFAVALSIGTITGFALDIRLDPVWFLHDAVAYPFLAAISCVSVVGSYVEDRLRRVGWLLIVMGTGSLALQLAHGWGYLGFPNTDPWYWNRFRGWSANPDQLALLCLALALLPLHLADTAVRTRDRFIAVACAILPIYVGRLSHSDTFTIAMLIALPMFVVLKLAAWLHSSERKILVRSAVAWMAIVMLPLILASVAPLLSVSAGQTTTLAGAILKDHGRNAARETAVRLHLWSEAWQQGLESGLLGLGPGPHLNIPSSIVAARSLARYTPKDIQHPALNGTPNFEAHNTLLGLFTQGGLLAILGFLWLVGTALVNAHRAQFAGLTTLVGGLFLFGLTGLIDRQPIFWFAIACGLVASAKTGGFRRGVAIPPFTASTHLHRVGQINRWRADADTNSGKGLA